VPSHFSDVVCDLCTTPFNTESCRRQWTEIGKHRLFIGGHGQRRENSPEEWSSGQARRAVHSQNLAGKSVLAGAPMN